MNEQILRDEVVGAKTDLAFSNRAFNLEMEIARAEQNRMYFGPPAGDVKERLLALAERLRKVAE